VELLDRKKPSGERTDLKVNLAASQARSRTSSETAQKPGTRLDNVEKIRTIRAHAPEPVKVPVGTGDLSIHTKGIQQDRLQKQRAVDRGINSPYGLIRATRHPLWGRVTAQNSRIYIAVGDPKCISEIFLNFAEKAFGRERSWKGGALFHAEAPKVKRQVS
jgi:hypothetical protein